jgi:hypothetical protein
MFKRMVYRVTVFPSGLRIVPFAVVSVYDRDMALKMAMNTKANRVVVDMIYPCGKVGRIWSNG